MKKIPVMLRPTALFHQRYRQLLIQPFKRNPVKSFRIRLHQQKLLEAGYSSSTEKLIVFLTGGFDIVNGGILSISSFYDETVKLQHIHKAKAVMCTVPGEPLLLRYSRFNNHNVLFRFSQALSYFKNLHTLMIHIPEFYVNQFLLFVSNADISNLKRIEHVTINVMIQNIQLLPPVRRVKELGELGTLTATTAHEGYTTPEMRGKLGFPLHKLSVFASPEQYNRKEYAKKDNLMIVSHDSHPKKQGILSLISSQLPELTIQIIRDLTYEEYRNVAAQAKWALTFGEGLDGYFLETIFSGGVSYAVYNTEYFTEDFESLRTVYSSYDAMLEKICADIKDLDNEKEYEKYQNEQYQLCSRYYSYEQYIRNLELFYKGEYTYK